MERRSVSSIPKRSIICASGGIDLEDARRLQMYGFVLDVLAESRVPQMNELFDREIGAKIEAL